MRHLSLLLLLVLVACGSTPARPSSFDPFDSWDVYKQTKAPPGVDVSDIATATVDAMESVQEFAFAHDFGPIRDMLARVEVVATEAAFEARLRALGLPRDGVAAAKLTPDGLLLAVTPAEHQRLDARASDDRDTYAWLLAKAIARALHLRAVGGDLGKLGPVWLREGFATMASVRVFGISSSPFSPLSPMTRDEALVAITTTGPEADRQHAAAIRAFLQRLTMKELVAEAARPDLSEWLAAGARPADTPGDCPTVEELHALVGKEMTDPAIVAMQTRLGPPSHQHAHEPRTWYHYAKHGISLVVTAGTALSEVNLRNADKGDTRWNPYCGALPGGIDLSWNDKRVHEALGRPEDYFANKWLTAGYHATFAKWGKYIEIFSLVEPFPIEVARIENISVNPDVKIRGVRSIELSFDYTYRDGEGMPSKFFYFGLRDDKGNLIASRLKDSLHVRDGRVSAKQQVWGDPKRVRMAIPYYVLELPEGEHRVTTDIALQLGVALGEVGRPAKVRAKSQAVTINMPKVRWVSTGVRSLRLAPGNYDRAVMQGDQESGKPDPHWFVCYDTLPYEDRIFKSEVRSNSHQGSWQSSTPFFPLLEGDTVEIRIYDEEVTTNDLIATFAFTYEELDAAGTLSRGKVESMVLAPLRERRGH